MAQHVGGYSLEPHCRLVGLEVVLSFDAATYENALTLIIRRAIK